MAGNFVPRLPTWNTTVINWIFDPLTGTRSLGSGFSAQMYPPFRTSDNPGPSDGYLVFPKSVTEVHDPTEYNNAGTDAVVFNWQGNDFGWKVIQLLPRWMNFPNEHWLALLQRMTAAELADIANPGNATYPTTVTAWLRDTTTSDWPTSMDIPCQLLYPQLTAAPGTMFGDFYMLFPTSSNVLRDKAEFNIDVFDYGFPEADVVLVEQPSGSANYVAYQVLQVHPRELGLIGEHLAARLARLTGNQAATFHGTPDAGTSTIAAAPSLAINDGVATTTISGTMLTAGSAPVIGATVVISSSGSAVSGSAPITDASGNYSTTATDTTAETVTFSAVCLGITVGPSNSVTFGSIPAHLSTPLDVTTGNGTCSNCADLNAGFTLDAIDSSTWGSSSFALACITSAGNAKWFAGLFFASGHLAISVQLYDVDTDLPILTWNNTNIDSWDGTSALTLSYVGGSAAAACAWNDPITITPS